MATTASYDSIVAASVAEPRVPSQFVGMFAGFALVPAAIGIYGVMAYSVAARRREMGIRMSLDAELRDIVKLMVGQGMRLALLSVAIGVTASWVLTRLISTLLFGVSATDLLAASSCCIADDRARCLLPSGAPRHAHRPDGGLTLRVEAAAIKYSRKKVRRPRLDDRALFLRRRSDLLSKSRRIRCSRLGADNEKWNSFADPLIFPNTMQHTRGASTTGGDEAYVSAESTCASAGHDRAKPGHLRAASGKGAHAGGRTESGPHLASGPPWGGSSASVQPRRTVARFRWLRQSH